MVAAPAGVRRLWMTTSPPGVTPTKTKAEGEVSVSRIMIPAWSAAVPPDTETNRAVIDPSPQKACFVNWNESVV